MHRFARALRITLLGRRDGAKLFSGTYLTDASVLQAQQELLARLVDAGFDLAAAAAADAWQVLYAYVIGHTIEEQALRQASDDRYDLKRRKEQLDPEEFPLATAAGRTTFGSPDERFERNVDRLIASFAAWRG